MSLLGLRVRTEYSFRTAFGYAERVVKLFGDAPVAITDRSGTWGHVAWAKAAARPVFGVELAVVDDLSNGKSRICWCTFIARNNDGLRELYALVSQASRNFYYVPRLDYSALKTSKNLAAIVGEYPLWNRVPRGAFCVLSPASLADTPERAKKAGIKLLACANPFYPTPDDRPAYEIAVGRGGERNPWPMHLISEEEWRLIWAEHEDAIERSKELLAGCKAELPVGRMVKFNSKKTLRQLCEAAAKGRGIDLRKKVYRERLDRELKLIADKQFEDYFFVISDMLLWAKERMLVGPARGSSCGSLVCYLLSIIEVDPIPYGLLFERFIDVNRKGLPDIDIDFPDDRRDMVFDYLREKYGEERVARLGTVSRYKVKSAIGDTAKALGVPLWETEELKSVIITRSSGDARAAFCILDSFNELEAGKAFLAKYPHMRIAAELEEHAKHSGQHAAGMLVTADPVNHFCSVDTRESVAMVDKEDAKKLNLLKIDCLGLRTLSILQDCLDAVGWTREQLYRYPTNDKAAYKVLNDERYAGIFQFEGYAVQGLAKQLVIKNFTDIAALTALARPGPLVSGGATSYVKRHLGEEEIEVVHPCVEPYVKETYGVVIYQEQVMIIAREIGKLSWDDVSELREAMSHSFGREFFDKFYVNFEKGALENGLDKKEAKELWERINTMGSWAFNKSHAVAYGLVSYWCCVLKAKFPLEFAAATLRNAKDDEQTIHLLREIKAEGYEYRAFDKDLSEERWAVRKGMLIGGLTNVKGIGAVKARSIIQKRREGKALSPSELALLENGKTPFDDIHETETLWGHIRKEPQKHGIVSPLLTAKEIGDKRDVTFAFIGKLQTKNIRDLNETIFLQKRNGVRLDKKTKYLNLTFQDDTDIINAGISRWDFERIGKDIYENGKIGDWYLMRGKCPPNFRRIQIEKIRKLP